ncbi:MAG: hypothetical protein JW395_0963 [Nitrospira sp.]|nr:hypothetical protein [Nitrospira sp.]
MFETDRVLTCLQRHHSGYGPAAGVGRGFPIAHSSEATNFQNSIHLNTGGTGSGLLFERIQLIQPCGGNRNFILGEVWTLRFLGGVGRFLRQFAQDVALFKTLGCSLDGGLAARLASRLQIELLVVQEVHRTQQILADFRAGSLYQEFVFARSDRSNFLGLRRDPVQVFLELFSLFCRGQNVLVPAGDNLIVLHRLRAQEDSSHGVVIGGGDGIELMVVAPCATHRQAHEGTGSRVHLFVHDVHLHFDGVVFGQHLGTQSEEAGSRPAFKLGGIIGGW